MSSGLYGQQYYIDKEAEHGAHNYRPIPVVISRGKGKRKMKFKNQNKRPLRYIETPHYKRQFFSP